MRLNELLAGKVILPDAYNPELTGVTLDSRQVTPGVLFFAQAGSHTHGAQFIDEALQRGAAAIITAGDSPDYLFRAGVPIIKIPDLQIGILAARFYHNPTDSFQNIIGVTGTNGKTSISYLLSQILNQFAPCALIGTLGIGLPGKIAPATHTTPDAITLQKLFHEWKTRNIRHAVMEVSSHALDQGRVAGINFDLAIFTNLTRDHLDYHHNMKSYGNAKRRLFYFPQLKSAVINTDDEFGRALFEELPEHIQKIGYGLMPYSKSSAQVQGSDLTLAQDGLRLSIATPWGTGILKSPWIGRFNALNLLAVFATLGVLEIPFSEILATLELASVVPGRMEILGGKGTHPLIIVDYAHTPDALEQVLRALREHTVGQLWCVFGCGGDRDRGKRPLMGRVAEQYADQVIITNDNPRTEDPGEIIQYILAGMHIPAQVIPDRALAIKYALQVARTDDVILIAGKGHENYQQIGADRFPFRDQYEVRRYINGD